LRNNDFKKNPACRLRKADTFQGHAILLLGVSNLTIKKMYGCMRLSPPQDYFFLTFDNERGFPDTFMNH